MTEEPDYKDIPGTFVFDAEQSRKGYPLNQFCMSLRQAANRDAKEGKDQDRFVERQGIQRQLAEERTSFGCGMRGHGGLWLAFRTSDGAKGWTVPYALPPCSDAAAPRPSAAPG